MSHWERRLFEQQTSQAVDGLDADTPLFELNFHISVSVSMNAVDLALEELDATICNAVESRKYELSSHLMHQHSILRKALKHNAQDMSQPAELSSVDRPDRL